MDLIGKRLGRYQILEALGTGAQATVYLAADTGPMKRRCALKVAHKDLSGGMSTTYLNYRIIRFVREAAIAGQFTHPNIVTVYEYGQDQGIHFIAMEYVEGYALSKMLKAIKAQKKRERTSGGRRRTRSVTRGRGERLAAPRSAQEAPSQEAIIEIIIQACEALHAINSRGIIHRDIKPGNILWVPETKTIKITDFGIAKVVNPELRTLLGDIMQDPLAKIPTAMTMEGDIIGTPMYMSPEQMVGNHQKLDHRSDIYSMGAVLFQMLTGKSPLEMDLERLEADVSPQIARILKKAVAKDPEDRFQSGEEFADALREVLHPPSRWRGTASRSSFRSLLYGVPLLALLVGGSLFAVKSDLLDKLRGRTSDSGIMPIPEQTFPPTRISRRSEAQDQDASPPPAVPAKPERPEGGGREAAATRGAPSARGILHVSSNVSGSLRIDDENRGWIEAGRTKRFELSPGTHRVVLSNSELQIRETRVVEIERGKSQRFDIKKQLKGTLRVESNVSGLTVFVDGRKRGVTQRGVPLKIPLPPGAYRVRLANASLGIDETERVKLRHRKTTSLKKAYRGRYQISTNLKVSVKLDGKWIHKTPVNKFELQATPGSHRLELINPIELPTPHEEELVFLGNKTRTKMILLQGR